MGDNPLPEKKKKKTVGECGYIRPLTTLKQ